MWRTLRVIACIETPDVIERILTHLAARNTGCIDYPRAPPLHASEPQPPTSPSPTLSSLRPPVHHSPVAPRLLRPSACTAFLTYVHHCRLQIASPRPRYVCFRTNIEPDNNHTDTPTTISIAGLFFLSVATKHG